MATLEFELFHCERYRMVAGWSSDYLMPTDRPAYRQRGYKSGWGTLKEVDAGLLAPGWSWEIVKNEVGEAIDWELDPAGQQVDKLGWSYAAGFSPTYEGVAKSSLHHMVRWRRLVRTQTFASNADLLVAEAAKAAGVEPEVPVCPYVDIDGAEHVGRLLVEAIAQASLYVDWSDHALAKLKRELLDRLVGSSKKGDKAKTLDAMIAEYSISTKGVGAFFKSHKDEELVARIAEVEPKFPAPEREAYAVLAIRRFRKDLACDAKAGEPHEECPLRPVLCENPGCNERHSYKHLAKHDETCPKKLLACERCKEKIPRQEMHAHATFACPHRDSVCCFSSLGCAATVKHCDLEKHLETSTQGHMMLMARTIVEQQETIKALTARLSSVEAKLAEQKAGEEARAKADKQTAAQIAALEKQLTGLSTKTEKDMKKATTDLTAATKTQVDMVNTYAKKEFAAVRAEIAKAGKAEFDAIKKDVTGMKASMDLVHKNVEKVEKEMARSSP